MIDFELSRRFHNVKGPDHIAVNVAARILEAVTHARLSGEMNDRFRREFFYRRPKLGVILEHRLGQRVRSVVSQQLVTPALESDVVIVGHSVIATHAKSFVKELPREVVANKATRSGNKHPPH